MKFSNISVLVLALLLTNPAVAAEFCGKELPEHHTWVDQPFKASATVGNRAPTPCTRIEAPPEGRTTQFTWKCSSFTLLHTIESIESSFRRIVMRVPGWQPLEDRWSLIDKTGNVFQLGSAQIGAVVTSETCNSEATIKTLKFERTFSVNGGLPITLRWSYQQLLKRKPVPQL